MRTVEEIKSAIRQLSLEERAEVATELCGWTDDAWDLQMKADAAAGKFKELNRAAFENTLMKAVEGPHPEWTPEDMENITRRIQARRND